VENFGSAFTSSHAGSVEETEEHRALMEQYEEFMNKNRSGEHGRTAQFWMLYSDLDILYLMFSRASRTNDLDLFAYCLAKLPSFLQQVGQITPMDGSDII